MKVTKKLLEQYVREVMKEANYTQMELPMDLPPKAVAEPAVSGQQPSPEPTKPRRTGGKPNTVRALLNSHIAEHMKDAYFQSLSLGPKELFRLYMLNSKWSDAWSENPDNILPEDFKFLLPKITNVIKMQSGITDVEYFNGDVESHQPYGVDVNQMYVRRRRWQ